MSTQQLVNSIKRQLNEIEGDILKQETATIEATLSTTAKLLNDLNFKAKQEFDLDKRRVLSDTCASLTAQRDIIYSRFTAFKASKRLASERSQLLHERHSSFHYNEPVTEGNLSNLDQFNANANQMQNQNRNLDEIINIGRNALVELGEQRAILKSTRTKLLDIANRIGLSQGVIRFIEKRSREDWYIFLVLCIVSLFLMYLIWRWLK